MKKGPVGQTPFWIAIADDYTGAADLAAVLADAGARPVVVFGNAASAFRRTTRDVRLKPDATPVVALRTRSGPAAEACRRVRAVVPALAGARQVYFKYSSTFDSTPAGNIGPVIDALLDALDTDFTVAVPAWPTNGRTQQHGNLFVGGTLLSESHMRDHPVTPMRDSNLVRVLQAQTTRQVGLIDLEVVKRGAAAIRDEIARVRNDRVAIALVDAIDDTDLEAIAAATADLRLLTGASGLASKLAAVAQDFSPASTARLKPRATGKGVLVVAGSCSIPTLVQLRRAEEAGVTVLPLDPVALVGGNRDELLSGIASRAVATIARAGAVIVAASADAAIRDAQARELAARGPTDRNVPRELELALADVVMRVSEATPLAGLIVTGGETAGTVIDALQIAGATVDAVFDPGVPCLAPLDGGPRLVLKPGNFGSADLFVRAIRYFISDTGRRADTAGSASRRDPDSEA